jgi:hypothetical protein
MFALRETGVIPSDCEFVPDCLGTAETILSGHADKRCLTPRNLRLSYFAEATTRQSNAKSSATGPF